MICTTVVDNFRELGKVYGNDGSERELDDVCAKKKHSMLLILRLRG